MSQIPPILNYTEEDIRRMLTCQVHVGAENVTPTMTRYVWRRNPEGIHIIDLRKTFEKIQLAARVICAMENPGDVCAVALTTSQAKQPPIAQRAVLKFSEYVGARHIAGRYTPGTFTNRIQSHFFEPRLLIASDPIKDFQPILESSYVNMPVIAMADVDCPTRHIDIVIPCNTKSKHSVALIWWMLAREVLRLKGLVPRDVEWNVLVDMFLYREPEEQEKQEKTAFQDQYAPNIWEQNVDQEAETGFEDRPAEENVGEDYQPETVGEPRGKGWNEENEWGDNENIEDDINLEETGWNE